MVHPRNTINEEKNTDEPSLCTCLFIGNDWAIIYTVNGSRTIYISTFLLLALPLPCCVLCRLYVKKHILTSVRSVLLHSNTGWNIQHLEPVSFFSQQISYYDSFLVGDQFNCMCATKEAIANATSVPEGNCRYQCPHSKYR